MVGKRVTAMKIEELDLSLRIYNALKRAGIDDVEQVRAMTVRDILSIRSIGVRSLAEIAEKVWDRTGEDGVETGCR